MMAYCPRCKNDLLSHTEDGFQRLLCDHCGFTYYFNPRPCVIGIPEKQGKVLFLKRSIEPSLNLWDLVGGFVEHMEHPEDALRREVREELGVEVGSLQYLGIYMDQYGNESFSTLNIAYSCTLKGDPFVNADEISELRWFDLNALPKKLAFASLKKVIEDLLKSKKWKVS